MRILVLVPEISRFTAPALRWKVLLSELTRTGHNIFIIEFPEGIPFLATSKEFNLRFFNKFITLSINLRKFDKDTFKINKVVKVALYERNTYYGIAKLISLLGRQFNPDIILASVPPPQLAIIAHFLSKSLDVPYIVDVRDLVEDYYLDIELKNRSIIEKTIWINVVLKKYLNSLIDSHMLIAVSEPFATVLKYRYNKEVAIVPNGATTLPRKDAITSINKRPKLLIYAGKLVRGMCMYYGLEAILQAWKEVVKIHSDYKLVIVGGGELLSKYIRYVKVNGIPNIVFTGSLPFEKTLSLALRSRGGIVWCNTEKSYAFKLAIPVKLFDYISAGLPVFAAGSKDTFVRLLIEKYGLGYYHIVKKCDYRALSNGLMEFINRIEKGLFDAVRIWKSATLFNRSKYAHLLCEILHKLGQQ